MGWDHDLNLHIVINRKMIQQVDSFMYLVELCKDSGRK